MNRRNRRIDLITLCMLWSTVGTATAQTPGTEFPTQGPFAESSQTLPSYGDLVARLDAAEAEIRQLRVHVDPRGSAEQVRTAAAMVALPPIDDERTRIEQIVHESILAHESNAPADSAAPADAGHVVGSDQVFDLKWNHGLEATTKNKDFRVHVGGRTQYDFTAFDAGQAVQYGAGGVGSLQDSINPRRARLRIDGTFWEVVDFVAEYDFVNDIASPVTFDRVVPFPAVTEAHVTLTKLPMLGNFRIGNFKDPISFEHLSSSRWLNFLERSPGFDAFYGRFSNGFVPGAMIFNCNESERVTWWTGIFKNNTNPAGFGVGDGELAWTSRVTGLPIWDAEGRYLVHLGGSYSYRDPDNGVVRFASRGNVRSGPPSPLNPLYADTGLISASRQQILNAELFSVWGPLTLQSEYSASFLDNAFHPAPPPAGPDRGAVFFQQTYVEALWFLTGEHRGYQKKLGQPDRVIPNENFWLVRGPRGALSGRGAWQVGARYSFLDLRDAGIDGGVLHGATAGLNWFLNPNMKLQWNYDFTFRNAPGNTSDGSIHGFGMRMAMDF